MSEKPDTQGTNKRAGRDRRQFVERRKGWDRRLPDRHYAPDEYIFREGDKAEHGYVVVTGTVSIHKLVDGEQRELATAGEGDLFGEMALIDPAPRSASARAVSDVVVKELNDHALKSYFSRSPDVAFDMMKRLATYVRTSNQALEVDSFSLTAKQVDEQSQQRRTSYTPDPVITSSEDNQYIIDEFQNPGEALLRRSMPPVIRWTFITIFAVFAAFLAWASLSIIDVTLSVPGKLTTTVPTVPIQTGDASMIKHTRVGPGQFVNKGDVIAILDPTIHLAEANKMQLEYEQLENKIKRLQMEKIDVRPQLSGSIDDQIQRELFVNRTRENSSKLASFDIDIERAGSMRETAEGKLAIARLSFEEAQLNYEKQQRLVAEDIVNSKVLDEARFSVSKARAEVKNAQLALNVAENDLSTAVEEKTTYESNRLNMLNEALTESILRQKNLQEELVKIRHQQSNDQILAPVDGVVLEVEKLFDGAIVSSGEVVATLVPTNVPLTVEMDIEPQSISNIVVGNQVSVKLTALPYQKHGDLLARITYLSEDTVNESISGEKGTFFRARAEIIENRLRKPPRDFRLMPGIQVSGDILTGKRRVITYFLYPVIRTLDTSFVEP